jgi:hypothetical protein
MASDFQPGQHVRCAVEPKHYDDVPHGAEGEVLRVAGDGRYVVQFGPFMSLWAADELEAA